MLRVFSVGLLMAIAGCSVVPVSHMNSACAAGEASYACQVERYHNVATQ